MLSESRISISSLLSERSTNPSVQPVMEALTCASAPICIFKGCGMHGEEMEKVFCMTAGLLPVDEPEYPIEFRVHNPRRTKRTRARITHCCGTNSLNTTGRVTPADWSPVARPNTTASNGSVVLDTVAPSGGERGATF